MITPKQLQQRFAYMFEGDNIGISIPKGWMPEFAKLCEQIDELLGADNRGFRWKQCKEKFGSARWYWSMKGGGQQPLRIDIISDSGVVTTALQSPKSTKPEDALYEQISDLIDEAESKTQRACIACGDPGKGDQQGGYVLVLCEDHIRQRKNGKLPELWLSEEESGQ